MLSRVPFLVVDTIKKKILLVDADGVHFVVTTDEDARLLDSCSKCSFRSPEMPEVSPDSTMLDYDRHDQTMNASLVIFGDNLGDLVLKFQRLVDDLKPITDFGDKSSNGHGALKIPKFQALNLGLENFCCTQGKQQESQSCPFIKGVFGLL